MRFKRILILITFLKKLGIGSGEQYYNTKFAIIKLLCNVGWITKHYLSYSISFSFKFSQLSCKSLTDITGLNMSCWKLNEHLQSHLNHFREPSVENIKILSDYYLYLISNYRPKYDLNCSSLMSSFHHLISLALIFYYLKLILNRKYNYRFVRSSDRKNLE